MQKDYHVMIVADSDFSQSVKDERLSRNKLYDFIRRKNVDCNVIFHTCSGMYSYGDGLNEFNVDDRNRTTFLKSIEYYLSKIDEAVIITNYEKEYYLSALTNKLSELYITTTTFGYKVG